MKYPNYCWVDVAYGGANNRNNLVDVRKVKPPKDAADCYRTVFRYPDAMQEHFRQRHSVAGYNGYVYADWIPIDVDSKSLEEAHEMAKKVLEQLATRYDVELKELKCFFSGSKGFHILIPADMIGYEPSVLLPAAFKEFVAGLFDDITLDLSIYETQRLFRLTNTKNAKSGLYKIPLHAAEILNLSLKEIKAEASKPREIIYVDEIGRNGCLAELFQKAMQVARAPRRQQVRENNNGQWDAYAVKPCITKLLEGVGEGNRDNAALRLAAHFLKQKLPSEMVMAALSAWNEKNMPPLKPADLKRVVESAIEHGYDFGCRDETLKEYCSEECKYRQKEAEAPAERRIKSIMDAFEAYMEYVRMLRKARITFGFGVIDERMRGLAPGEVCQVIARSSVGKTTLMINMIHNLREANVSPILFFTMEMPLPQVYERMAQIELALPGNVIEMSARELTESEDYETEYHGPFVSYARRVHDAYSHCYFVEEDCLRMDQLESLLSEAEIVIGQKPRLVMIDYMGRMQAPGTPYEATSSLAKGMKYLAKKFNVAVVSLHQVGREKGKDGTEPLTLESARDSGAVEEAADFLIGMWRPEKKKRIEKQDEKIVLALLKNRRGTEVRTELLFHKPTLRMTVYQREPGDDFEEAGED